MKKISLKHLLSVFLMVLCFGLTTTISAQSNVFTVSGTSTSEVNFPKVDKAVTTQSIIQEVATLKVIAKASVVGSEAYVDAMRRIEVFLTTAEAMNSGETTRSAYDAGVNHLYKVLHFKEADSGKLIQIQQTLLGFFTN